MRTSPMRCHPTAAAAAIVTVLAPAGQAIAQAAFVKSDVFFELNATDGDIGLHGILDADVWKEARIDGPGGSFNVIRAEVNDDSAEFGLNELVFESNEPPLENRSFMELLTLFPPGQYRFSATSPDGQPIVGSDALTDDMPCPPVVRVTQPGKDVILRWRLTPGVYNPDTSQCASAGGVTPVSITAFLQLEDEATGAKRSFEVVLPPDARAVEVPDALFTGVNYDTTAAAAGVNVQETSGNKTAIEFEFELKEP